jgi:hypothetical protein
MMPLAEIKIITDGGPWANHNMPCPICLKNPAVMHLWNGTFQPCWECQGNGYLTLKLPKYLNKILRKYYVKP